jgi:hypothetical protein
MVHENIEPFVTQDWAECDMHGSRRVGEANSPAMLSHYEAVINKQNIGIKLVDHWKSESWT